MRIAGRVLASANTNARNAREATCRAVQRLFW